MLYFKKFCENPIENIEAIYKPLEAIDKGEFVYEGVNPTYHKFENCVRLTSNFINFKIPEEIRTKGDDAINEFRNWFKINQNFFSEKPDGYQARLQSKYGINQEIEIVDYRNSGSVYKENLSLSQIETRINSLLSNAAVYYKSDEKRAVAIRAFQKATFLAFKSEEIPNNRTDYSDSELKEILREYNYLFIQPILINSSTNNSFVNLI